MVLEKQLEEFTEVEVRLKLKQDLAWIRTTRNQKSGSSYACFGHPGNSCLGETFTCKLCRLIV